ncbi:MAG TPA: hypothetical protein PKD54_03985 [Pirellulaceae bacterium]|nr:hypothetical protein [Pirellulaceae bacterium]
MQLGSMGTPIKVDVKGQPVYLCCEGCRNRLLADPERYLQRLRELIEQYASKPQPPIAPQRDGHQGH